jgi:Glycosyltransferase family 87
MNKKQLRFMNVLLILMGLALIFELIRDSMRGGDFIGYVNAGNLVLNNQDIYSDFLNTWPPFFSVFSVFIAWGDMISSFLIRFLWLFGSIVAMYYTIKVTIKMVLNKSLNFSGKNNGVVFQDLIVMIPLLILFRYVMDNLANIQINIFMLYCSLLCLVFFIKKKYIWFGLLLGLTISLKVYTIFILFYFIYKREYRAVLWTFFFVILFNIIPFLVFGVDKALAYYQQWVTEIAPRSYLALHKNQSVFGLFLRFFTSEELGNNMLVNLFDLDSHRVKVFTYVSIIVASIYPAYLFRKKFTNTSSLSAIFEYSFLFTVIPILSPLSWKAYFIFLWIPYFLIYLVLFRTENQIPAKRMQLMKYLFRISIALYVFSTEAIVGPYFSDVLESYSAITIGTILLLIIQIIIIKNINLIDLNKVKYQALPKKED